MTKMWPDIKIIMRSDARVESSSLNLVKVCVFIILNYILRKVTRRDLKAAKICKSNIFNKFSSSQNQRTRRREKHFGNSVDEIFHLSTFWRHPSKEFCLRWWRRMTKYFTWPDISALISEGKKTFIYLILSGSVGKLLRAFLEKL